MGHGASAHHHDQQHHEEMKVYHEEYCEPSSKEPCKFTLGDIVLANLPDGESKEGLIIEVIGRGRVRVDCGDQVRLLSVLDCTILKGATELEVGDKVEMQPTGSFLYFTGEIIKINNDGTYDIAMEGDASDGLDIESNVPRDNIRKLASNRLKLQFKKGGWAVVAMNAFANSASTKGVLLEK